MRVAATTASARSTPGAALVVLSAFAAAVIGAAMAIDVRIGLTLLAAACYLPLVALNLPLALIAWLPLVFLEGVPFLNLGAKLGGLCVTAAWLLGLAQRRHTEVVPTGVRRVAELVVLLIVWLTLSLAWASDTAAALADIWHWWAVAVLFGVVATTLTTEQTLRWAIVALIIGGCAAVLVGLATGQIVAEDPATVAASGEDVRLAGGAGDPNLLAAGLAATLALAAGLAAGLRSLAAKTLLAAAAALMAVGVVASQSRGGILAVGAALVAGIVLSRGRRAMLGAFALVAIGAAALWLAVSPGSLARITTFEDGGSGREDIWKVAEAIASDHPFVGVGLNNFAVTAPTYVRDTGPLQQVHLLTEDVQVVHNQYLQLLTENGLPGAVLFIGVAFGCLVLARRAGKRFAAAGMPDLEALAHGVQAGIAGLLAANVFLSGGVDKRLWILLALGPALELLAHRTAPTPAAWAGRR